MAAECLKTGTSDGDQVEKRSPKWVSRGHWLNNRWISSYE